tara:strand:- start:975 stop:1502 length:528 start_codon:yes stop_codon:yes gene_type:complete
MSGFTHGGSALTLDIGVRNDTGNPCSNGDIVQIDFLQLVGGVNVAQDGLGAIQPVAGAAINGWSATAQLGSGYMSVTGSVIAPQGHTIMATEEMTIRIAGAAEVSVLAPGGGLVIGDLLDVSPGASNLVESALNGGNLATASAAATGLLRGVALENLAAGATAVISVWLKPFGGI